MAFARICPTASFQRLIFSAVIHSNSGYAFLWRRTGSTYRGDGNLSHLSGFATSQALTATTNILLTVHDSALPCNHMNADLLKLKLTLLKRILGKVRELFNKPTDVHYTSVPLWRPWRDC